MKFKGLINLSDIRKYKGKYTTIKDVYDSIRKDIKVKSDRGGRMLDYGEYFSIIEAYLDEVIDVVVKEQEVFSFPKQLGKIHTKRLPHKRPFHIRLDHKESILTNKPVYYKVPILDDEYTKLVWDRPYKYGKYKILPLKRFKESIKQH